MDFKECNSGIACGRSVSASVAYCCWACSKADEGGYEIHESGLLGHSQDCQERHAERGFHPLSVQAIRGNR